MQKSNCLLKDRAIVKVSGKDKKDLLNSLLTNNLEKLQESRLIYSLLLNPQGKFLHDMMIFLDQENNYLIDIDSQMKDEFIKRINFYKLRSDIVLEPEASWKIYHILGANSPEIETCLGNQEKYFFEDPRLPTMGYRSYVKNNVNFPFENHQYDLHRIKQAVAEGAKDLTYGRSFPLHFDLQYLNAIDYQKGCYVGQEVVARTTYRGSIRKFVIIIEAAEKLAKDAVIYTKDNEEIGFVSSSFDNYSLGIVNKFSEELIIEGKISKASLPDWAKGKNQEEQL